MTITWELAHREQLVTTGRMSQQEADTLWPDNER